MTFRINGENNSFEFNQKSTLKPQKKQTEDFSKLQEILSNYSGQKNDVKTIGTPQSPSPKIPQIKDGRVEFVDNPNYEEELRKYEEHTQPHIPSAPQPPSEKLPRFKDDGSIEWIDNPDYDEQMRKYEESSLPQIPRVSEPPVEKIPCFKDDGSIEWIDNPNYEEQMRQYKEKNTRYG